MNQNYFPVVYQPYQYSPQFQNAYQSGQNFQPVQPVQPTQSQQQIVPQAMTPPTVHADMIVVPSEQNARDFPVGAGETQLFIASDDSAIFAKTASKNGQISFISYDRRPDAPPEPKFNPSEYVRRDEVKELVRSMIAQNIPMAEPAPTPSPARRQKREGTDE